MTPTTVRAARVGAAAVLALGLTACGESSPSTPAPATVTVTQTPTPQGSTGPEHEQLTTAQIRAALPTARDVPDVFRLDARGFDTSSVSTRTTDPASCLALYMTTDDQQDFTKDHGVADGGVRFTRNAKEPGSPSISVGVWSHDETYPRRFFDEAGAALGECTEFSSSSSEGAAAAEWKAAAIPTPTLGDQSFGVRIGSGDIDLAIDYLWVRSGRNLIHVRMLTSQRVNNDDQLKATAQGVLDALGE
ncbi:MAG: hypothetical protein L0G89_09250 [Janibacter sp.]|nr:hypothetical protein [Janibacter sp.]